MGGIDWGIHIENDVDWIRANNSVMDYFVDNVKGSATGYDGLSWATPFAEPSQAITAWEAKRLLLDDPSYRARIFIRGTEDAYAALTALPSYCQMIGVGAEIRGNGVGIPRIGLDDGTTSGVLVAGTARGLDVSNILFQSGYGLYPFKITNMFRCGFHNCGFGTASPAAGDPPPVGFEIDKASGLVIENCHWMNASSKLYGPVIGINITGTHFHNCLVRNNFITGVDFGVVVASGCVFGYGSVFRDNYIGEAGQVCAVGVDDNATDGWIQYLNNYIAATAAGQLANNGTMRWIANKSSNGFSTVAAE